MRNLSLRQVSAIDIPAFIQRYMKFYICHTKSYKKQKIRCSDPATDCVYYAEKDNIT
jgi:hypothetical protein